MRTQALYAEDRRVWGDTGPLTDQLKISDPISAIDFIFRGTNGATSNTGDGLHGDIDRVELVSGSDRLYSLSLPQAIIQHFHENKKYPKHVLTEDALGVQEESIRMSFGRFLGDPEYWLDPTQFKNLAWRLTGDLTISATVGFGTGTRDVTIIAHTMAKRPPVHRGWFMTKEVFQVTTLASGERRIQLPDDFPYRMYGFRARETGIAFDVDVTNLKLTQGKDKFVYHDLRALSWRDIIEQQGGVSELDIRLLRANAATPSLIHAYNRGVTYNVITAADTLCGHQTETVDQVTLVLLEFSTPATPTVDATARPIATHARGVLPHFGGCYMFGDPNDPSQWLEGDEIKDLEMVVTEGGAGAALSLWVQQVRN